MHAATARPGQTVRQEGEIRVEETRTKCGDTVTVKRVKYCPKGIIRRSEISFREA